MRILVIDAYFEPEQTAFTHLENDLLDELVKAGHDIEIVCPTPTRGIDDKTRIKYKKIRSEELKDGHIRVTRFWAPNERKNPALRAFRYIWCNLRSGSICKRIKDIDLVFSNSTPPTQGVVAGKVAKKLKVPFVYCLQDIFPDSLVNAGLASKGSLIWKIGRSIEKKTYEKADLIIVISEEFKINLLEKGVREEKVKVIPNWINIGEVYPIDRKDNRIIARYGLDPNKFYICYSGNIGHSQNIELLLRVAERMQLSNEDIEFVIIGEGAEKENLIKAVERYKLTNLHVFPLQPYEDIAHVFSLGDVGLVISKPGIGGSSVPSKTWSIMAAKRPVLASFDPKGELFRVITENGCGEFVNAGDEEGLIAAIKRMYSDREELKRLAENGYEYVTTKISKERCTREYVTVIEDAKNKSNY